MTGDGGLDKLSSDAVGDERARLGDAGDDDDGVAKSVPRPYNGGDGGVESDTSSGKGSGTACAGLLLSSPGPR